MTSPEVFHLFPQLPTEIRLRIWHFVSPSPRTVAIEYDMRIRRPGGNGSPSSAWRTTEANPVTLCICQESRVEAMKSYQTAFSTQLHQSNIYFDFNIDTLRFGHGSGDEFLTDPDWVAAGPSDYALDIFLGGIFHGADDAEKVKRMIFDFDTCLFYRKALCWDEVRLFTGLEELTIMDWQRDDQTTALTDSYSDSLSTTAKAHSQWAVPKIIVQYTISGRVLGPLRIPVDTALFDS